MYCHECGYLITKGAKFCENCGTEIQTHPESQEIMPASNTAPVITRNLESATKDTCQICDVVAPTKYNEFYANIGMLFMRRQLQIKGKMCKKCTNTYFWKYTGTNLFLGWWGFISFFATCFFMLNNIFRYVGSLSLKENYQ